MVHVHMNKLRMTQSTVCPGLTVEIRTFRRSRKLFLLHDCWLHSSIMSISGEKDSGCSLFWQQNCAQYNGFIGKWPLYNTCMSGVPNNLLVSIYTPGWREVYSMINLSFFSQAWTIKDLLYENSTFVLLCIIRIYMYICTSR